MRIYGGHDFYDCGLSLGIDPSIILVRGKSKSIPVDVAGGSLRTVDIRLKSRFSDYLSLETVSVAFCGKVYRGLLAKNGLQRHEGIWSLDGAKKWCGQFKDTSLSVHTGWREEKMTLEKYFAPFPASKELWDYMIANKVSIMVDIWHSWHDEKVFEINPYMLKQIGFAKALDPYTAFQELSMWIGGVLGGTSPEIVRITDDQVLIANHGFDKHSFRSSVRTA